MYRHSFRPTINHEVILDGCAHARGNTVGCLARAHVLEIVAGRAQVEDHLIRVLDSVHTAQPRVQCDACLIGQIHDAGDIVTLRE